MPGQEAELIRQGEHFLPDAIQQGIHITTGEIRSAHAVHEDEIPTEHHSLIPRQERHMSDRMARRVTHFEIHFAQTQDHAMVQGNRGLGSGIEIADAEGRCAAMHPPQRLVVGMEGDWDRSRESICNGGCPTEVIEVGMGEPDLRDPPSPCLRLIKDKVPIPGRIDHNRLTEIRIPHEIRVSERGAELESDDL